MPSDVGWRAVNITLAKVAQSLAQCQDTFKADAQIFFAVLSLMMMMLLLLVPLHSPLNVSRRMSLNRTRRVRCARNNTDRMNSHTKLQIALI